MHRGLLILLLLSLAASVRADVIHLKNGREIEGVIAAESGESITIETRLGRVTLPRSQVARIEPSDFELPTRESEADDRRAEFFERLSALDPEDALGLAELSRWCREHGLEAEAEQAEEMAVTIAPEDEAVRKRLGHFHTHSGWVTAEAYWRGKGLVPYEGEWVTPEERIRRRGKEHSQDAHKKRRELSLRAKYELPQLLEGVLARDEGQRRASARAVRERLQAYGAEGRVFLQGMRPQGERLETALTALENGDFLTCRNTCVEVMLACNGVLRWEEAAAIALDVAGLQGALKFGKIEPTRRERAAMDKINRMRRQMGMAGLSFSEALYRAAAGHDLDMIARGYVDHVSPTPGRADADQRGHAAGASGQIGENIYYGGLTADEAVRGWGGSLGHSANMFDAGWFRGGLAAVGRHWTHNFSR